MLPQQGDAHANPPSPLGPHTLYHSSLDKNSQIDRSTDSILSPGHNKAFISSSTANPAPELLPSSAPSNTDSQVRSDQLHPDSFFLSNSPRGSTSCAPSITPTVGAASGHSFLRTNCRLAVAVSATLTLSPAQRYEDLSLEHGATTVGNNDFLSNDIRPSQAEAEFAVVWHMPLVRFRTGQVVYKRCVYIYTSSCLCLLPS
ncbi:unnamed protein product [Protopolystoma xenopodis]|uniref:Uncharacterized protein n=1 Tax=Protopolystoma xenopodis TaxID=117903 RepID=A0A448X3Z3_9PLAT|nr:unnamed protein product [Protopolystoma xenopodis]